MSREVVKDVLGPVRFRKLWGAGYDPVLPVTTQDFAMGSVLPMVLYIQRWGFRRGLGEFRKVYGEDATSFDVAKRLSLQTNFVDGFNSQKGQEVLADLLLAFCLENRNHRIGREIPVQRVLPTHYFSSWIDLPDTSVNLRRVPELIVAILAQQKSGDSIRPEQSRGFFGVAGDFNTNLLLRVFGKGCYLRDSGQIGQAENYSADQFDESAAIGIDQLATIRVAQLLKSAPLKLRKEEPRVVNQWPVALSAANRFYEDFNIFLRVYGDVIPRLSLVPMLESSMSIGLTSVVASSLDMCLVWEQTGTMPERHAQKPWPLFVDCSGGTDRELRQVSEESFDELTRRFARLPIIMMCMRLASQWSHDEKLTELPDSRPDPTNHLNFLGRLITGNDEQSRDLRKDHRRECNRLADALLEAGEIEYVPGLKNEQLHPTWRLAEALVGMMGDKAQITQFNKFLDSALMSDQANGISVKRRPRVKGRLTERRSIVLNNIVLDYLVHRHVRKGNKRLSSYSLSVAAFIEILEQRYGYHVSTSPLGTSVPESLLLKNRQYLERRLRDLGLFIGVNDAEAMKQLHARFKGVNGKEIPDNAQ